jgi:aminoglycoside phosphotransferase (APT) family kinase protein
MLPSQPRLIQGIRRSLAALLEPDRSAEDRKLAGSIMVGLDELLLRHDRPFLDAQIESGTALVAAAETLARRLGAPYSGRLTGGGSIDELSRALQEAVTVLASFEKSEPAVKPLLAGIVDWENALHARRLQPAAALDSAAGSGNFSAEAIEGYLSQKHPEWRPVRVSDVRQLSGGFSKATILFDVEDPVNGKRTLVIRAEQPMNLIFLEGTQITNEYHVLRRALAAGVPVAEPLWLEEDATRLGARLLVSRRAPGRNFGSRVDVRETISDNLLRDVLRRLVQIHAIPVDPANPDIAASHLSRWTRYATLTDCIRAQVAFWKEESADFGLSPAPILTRALAWLEQNVPDNPAAPVLLHGDYGLHNLLIDDDDSVACILDWEAASVGDPADDLVWLSEGLQGSVERRRIMELYHELGGRPVSETRLRFFDVMNTVRFAVTCPRALYLFEQHPAASIDACQLGLLYMYHGTGKLNRNIELAEEAASVGR